MPTRLSRYVLAEILKIFVVSLLVLTTLVLLIAVAREALSQGLGAAAVLRLMPFALTISLQHALPATSLFSVCCVYGRMSADGEVATVKASGISPLILLQPALAFALLLSPVSVYLTDLAVSWGRPGIERVVLASIEDITYRVLKNQHSYTSEHGFSIHVRDVVGDRLIRPTVTVEDRRSGEAVKVTAEEGKLSLDPDTGNLVLTVLNSRLEQGSRLVGSFPGEDRFEIPLATSGVPDDIRFRSPSVLPLRLIRSERIREDGRVHATSGQLAAHAGFAILTSRPEAIAGGEGRGIEQSLVGSRKRLTRLHTEPWRRWAEGFTCFVFVLVGAPLAMLVKTNDYWTTFGLCFLPILVTYYPLFLLGLDQAKDGSFPPYGVWIGNVVLGTCGLMLIARVRRY